MACFWCLPLSSNHLQKQRGYFCLIHSMAASSSQQFIFLGHTHTQKWIKVSTPAKLIATV